MSIKIALAGNPNSGKTTLFNTLTGTTQYVGNWPGVTVEKKEGKIKRNKDITVVDLPGIYSLSPYTLEEVIARNFLINEKPDVIINIVDTTNMERNLYLTTQLMELGIPVVIALNMMDIILKTGDKINAENLRKLFNCEVVEISALKNRGTKDLIEAVRKAAEEKKVPSNAKFSLGIENDIASIMNIANVNRWTSIKLFENDEKIIEEINLNANTLSKIEEIRTNLIKKEDNDVESIIIDERYNFVTSSLPEICVRANIDKKTISQKIDSVVTNRWLALPIFAVVIFTVYYLAISSVGGFLTDFINDTVFGPNGIPYFVETFLTNINAAGWLIGLIVDGIIGGVGAVLGFLPQMLVLFLLLGFLEDTGYMSRIAFILDKIFRKFGLSGKSFIPMLISTGCAVPGIMATRTIGNRSERRITMTTTSFMPCSAKLPIIALISGAMFRGSSYQFLIAPSAYFIGIIAVIISGVILKKIKVFRGEVSPFVMELPNYHWPRVKNLTILVYDKLKSFVIKAGTIILLAAVFVWFLSSFSWNFKMVSENESMLADVGRTFAVLFKPLGWGDWKATVATFTGLIAKENVVGTFGVLYGFSEVAANGMEIWEVLSVDFTALSAYSFLIFNLLCAPCFAAIGAIKKEAGSFKWMFFAITYQTVFAYLISFIIYQIGMIFITGFSFLSALAILVIILFVFMIIRPDLIIKRRKDIKCGNL